MGKLFSAREAAAQLQIELEALYRYAQSGVLQGVKHENQWSFTDDAIQNFIRVRPYHSAGGQTPRLLQDALRIAATECGERVKFVSGTERFSYAQIELYSDRLASRLITQHVLPGDRVIVGLPNSAAFIVACFAVWKARAVVVALDPGMLSANLRHILERTEPTAVIAGNGFAARVQGMPEILGSLHAFFLTESENKPGASRIVVESLQAAWFSEAEPVTLPADAQPEDLATINFTSGSTGTPKGVMHTHETTLACASFTLAFLELSKSDVMMVPLPLHHILAFRRFLTCFLAQCTLVIAPDIFIMKQFQEFRPTGLVLVPSACNILVDNFSAFFHDKGDSLRYVEIGSEPISPERLGALQAILPQTQIHLTYGLTEGRVGYLKPGPNGVFDRLASSNQGLEVKVVDTQGAPLRPGEAGEILLTGSGLFKGYWGDSPEALAEIRNNGFRTGDMGLMDGKGEVQLMGRMDDMVKVGGHKVNPREVEAVLQRHPGVAEAVVLGFADTDKNMGSALHAFVVPKKGTRPTAPALMAHCREHLELYKVPGRIYFRESLPKTALGKIQRHLVAQSAAESETQAGE
jgi:long-chain acyl-CoA synthetase